ncbi:MAG TPA: hypothetical protein VMU89_03290, partial [Thermomicrobiaceae bacterium]|nr:hypothetical protein [Thermomicrobiaceae bacterium]
YLIGELDGALATYAESLRLHEEIGDQGGLVLTLLGFAAVAHRQSDAMRSAVLCGAADALRGAHRMVLQPAIQAIYEREVAMVVDLIGPEAFAEGFARGAEMTTAEALAYARQALPGR